MASSEDSYRQFADLIRARKEMEGNWDLSQENILPLEQAWNTGRFYGLVLKGKMPFSWLQRAGIFVLGFQTIIMSAIFFIAEMGYLNYPLSLRSRGASSLEIFLMWLPQLLLLFLLGLRVCWVALKPLRPPN